MNGYLRNTPFIQPPIPRFGGGHEKMHFYLVAEVFEIEPDQIWKPSNQPLRVKAGSLVCYWAVRELGMSGTSVGKLLGLGQPAVSRAVVRGEKLTQYMNLSLIK